MKKWIIGLTLSVFVVAMVFGFAADKARAAEEIKWGVLIDLSGPTSDWGKNQVKGQLDAILIDPAHGIQLSLDLVFAPVRCRA